MSQSHSFLRALSAWSRGLLAALSLIAATAGAPADGSAQPVRDLTITVAGTGAGTVTSAPAGINCPGDCAETYGIATTAVLTFTPAAGSTFISATGSCSATGPSLVPVTDSLLMSQNRACTVTFSLTQHALSVTVAGAGSGSVASAPAGINCASGTCAADFNEGAAVTLTPTASAGSLFAGWSGACAGAGAATVTISAATACTATFTSSAKTLLVSLAGSGSGTVTSSHSGLVCSAASAGCSGSFATGTVVALAASPAAGSSFTGWSGCVASTDPFLTVTIAADTICTATFATATRTLTVRLDGDGRGTVTSNPDGLSCTGPQGSTCSAAFAAGTTVTLTAVAASGSALTGWSQACTATGPQTAAVTLNEDATCTASLGPGPIVPERGWWWNQDEAGRGYSIEVSSTSGETRLFLGAYMYDRAGNPTWYVSPMTTSDEGRTYVGTLMYFRGGQTLLGAYATPIRSPIGDGSSEARVEFTSETEGLIVLPAPDATTGESSTPISRFPIVSGGLTAPLPADATLPKAGWWWNPEESGRGLFVEIQADAGGNLELFTAIYGYEESGDPSWSVGMSSLIPSASGWVASSMSLQRCAGGGGAKPVSCAPLAAGSVTIQFRSDGIGGVVTLPNGTQVPIQRYVF